MAEEESGRPVQPALLEGLHYDGPPELAAAWDAFTRRFAAVEKPGKKARHSTARAWSRPICSMTLPSARGGATGFLKAHGIRTMRQSKEMPALAEEAQGPTRTVEVLGLQDESDRARLTQLRKDIEDAAVALGEATAKEAEDHAPARELFNAVNRRLIAQWAERERPFGLYPPVSRKGDIPQPVRIRRQALLDDAEGELLSGTLYSLQTPVLVKAGYELLWHRLRRREETVQRARGAGRRGGPVPQLRCSASTRRMGGNSRTMSGRRGAAGRPGLSAGPQVGAAGEVQDAIARPPPARRRRKSHHRRSWWRIPARSHRRSRRSARRETPGCVRPCRRWRRAGS